MQLSRYYILLALAEGPAHGAEISKQIIGDTAGRGYVSRSSLYDDLQLLGQKGLIRCVPVHGRKRIFNLTPRGSMELANETRVLRMALQRASLRIGV